MCISVRIYIYIYVLCVHIYIYIYTQIERERERERERDTPTHTHTHVPAVACVLAALRAHLAQASLRDTNEGFKNRSMFKPLNRPKKTPMTFLNRPKKKSDDYHLCSKACEVLPFVCSARAEREYIHIYIYIYIYRIAVKGLEIMRCNSCEYISKSCQLAHLFRYFQVRIQMAHAAGGRDRQCAERQSSYYITLYYHIL